MELSGFPAAEVEFDRAGRLIGDEGAAVGRLAAGATDLLVLCHGWSHRLYAALAKSLRSVTLPEPPDRARLRAMAVTGARPPSPFRSNWTSCGISCPGSGSPSTPRPTSCRR